MSQDNLDDPLLDDSPTDELPVLSEQDIVDDDERAALLAALALNDDTQRDDAGPATGSRRSADAEEITGTMTTLPDQGIAAANPGAAPEAARIEALEARLEHVTTLWSAARAEVADKEATIASLEERLEATRQAVLRRDETEKRLRSLLADRDGRLAALQPESASQPDADAEDVPEDEDDGLLSAAEVPADAPSIVCLTSAEPLSYPLSQPVTTIGRGNDCDIHLATHFVSREHARLSVEKHGVVLQDLGSKNGVFVNSVRVDRETLRNGDLITVGEAQFRFVSRPG